MMCLDDNAAAALASGVMPDTRAAQARAHLDECDGCRHIVAAAVKSTHADPSDDSSTVVAATQEHIPGDRVGRFVIVERVGAGGMGVVYAAYDAKLDRRVALKFVRPFHAERRTALQDRLQTEAKVVAQLSHPNVVAVHDTGESRCGTYVAMEYVDGESLRGWLRQRRRSWQSVVTMMAAVGRGLAAAHDAGLVHRDVKPENILVDSRGRPRIVDFGLAKEVNDTSNSSATSCQHEHTRFSSHSAQTTPGTMVGTPRYIAPEVARGFPHTPASDQFSFFLTLCEALYGAHPYSFQPPRDVHKALASADPVSVPTSKSVPSWLRRILGRGLAKNPSDRYPSMHAVVRELSRRRKSRQRISITAVAVALCAGSLALGTTMTDSRPALCETGAQRMSGIWNDDIRARIASHFDTTRSAFAQTSKNVVLGALARYATSWVSMHEDNCRATYVRHEQTERTLELRTRCLNERFHHFSALVGRLTKASDPRALLKTPSAVESLPTVAACEHTAALSQLFAPPTTVTQRRQLDDAQRRLAQARVLKETGDIEGSRELATQLATNKAVMTYAPLAADVLSLLGTLQSRSGDHARAEGTLRTALDAAARARAPKRMAEIRRLLIYIVGYRLHRFTDADELMEEAHRDVLRAGGEPLLRARLLSMTGLVYGVAGKFAERETAHRDALALLGQAEATPRLIAEETMRLGLALSEQGKFRAAADLHRRALRALEAHLGPAHSRVAACLLQLANALGSLEEFDEAIAHHKRAIHIWKDIYGDVHHNVAAATANLGSTYAEAGDQVEALRHLEASLEIRRTLYPKDHPQVAYSLYNIGALLLEQQRWQEAYDKLKQSRAIFQRAFGTDHPAVALTLTGLAAAEVNLDKPGRAITHVERALEIYDHTQVPPEQLGDAKRILAIALSAQGVQRRRALRMAREARAIFVGLGGRHRATAKQIAQWLKQRGARLQ